MGPWFDANYVYLLGADMIFRWVAYSTFGLLLLVIARRLKPRNPNPRPNCGCG